MSGTHADAFIIPRTSRSSGRCIFSDEAFEKMLPRKLTTELGPDMIKQFGFGLDSQTKKFGHDAASAAPLSVDVKQKVVVMMTRNKMGKNQGKYNVKFWDAISAGLEPLK